APDMTQAVSTERVPARCSGAVLNLEPTLANGPTDAGVGLTLAAEKMPLGGVFGEYDLLELVARGGMGIVFRARHRQLDRIVALKMILAGQLASEMDIERFRAEAQAAAHLDHPGIVPVHEAGEQPGLPFFTMASIEAER